MNKNTKSEVETLKSLKSCFEEITQSLQYLNSVVEKEVSKLDDRIQDFSPITIDQDVRNLGITVWFKERENSSSFEWRFGVARDGKTYLVKFDNKRLYDPLMCTWHLADEKGYVKDWTLNKALELF
jgi:hypothetical protein